MPEDYCSRCPVCGSFVILRCGETRCLNLDCDWRSPVRQVEEMIDSRNLGGPLFVPPTTRKPYPGERKA